MIKKTIFIAIFLGFFTLTPLVSVHADTIISTPTIEEQYIAALTQVLTLLQGQVVALMQQLADIQKTQTVQTESNTAINTKIETIGTQVSQIQQNTTPVPSFGAIVSPPAPVADISISAMAYNPLSANSSQQKIPSYIPVSNGGDVYYQEATSSSYAKVYFDIVYTLNGVRAKNYTLTTTMNPKDSKTDQPNPWIINYTCTVSDTSIANGVAQCPDEIPSTVYLSDLGLHTYTFTIDGFSKTFSVNVLKQ